MKKFKTTWLSIAALLVIALIAVRSQPINPETVEMFNGSILPFEVVRNYEYELRKKDGTFHVYLSSSIEKQSGYKDLVRGLRLLTKEDTVVLHLANFGGFVQTGVMIINAMKASKAHIIANVEAPSYSMGALIACAGDEIKMEPYSFLMFHDYSGDFAGKGSEAGDMIRALDKMSLNLLMNECVPKGILTEEQANSILRGVDVYVHPDTIHGDN
jgi:ATP-dependent protease ClpP protease subunit